MILALILICLAVAIGLGGFLLGLAKWVLIVALVLLIAGVVAGAVNRKQL
jgi:hypothetical protein